MFIQHNKKNGFTLIEAIVGTAIFVLLALSVYQAYLTTMNVIRLSRVKVTATALGNEQLEIIRNLPYHDVGIVSGLPLGKIPAEQTLIRDNKEFTVHTVIRNIDDPFDGTIGGSPNDTSPADYKLVSLTIDCATCKNFSSLNLNTYIAAKNLESASNNGALFIEVFDASGQPVTGANVYIENNKASPTFTINDTTNNKGLLEIVDAPPGIEAYEITVSKDGYTSEKTYLSDDSENPNPLKPHATVEQQKLTQISFYIDKVSTLNISSVDESCQAVPNIDFSLQGLKIIGTDPNIYKYTETSDTGNSGIKEITDLDWDSYNLTFIEDVYDLIGAIPETSFILNPDSTQDLKLIVRPPEPKTLLVTIKDASTNLPLSDVSVHLTGEEYDNLLTTGRGFIRQTDWSLGAGQENYLNFSKYFDSDNQVEIADPVGVIELKKYFDEYTSSAWLISSTFDTGSASDFHQILWQPQNQPEETGSDSVRLQIATNNNKEDWDFLGPDGSANTFYTNTNQTINPIHNGDRYLRYKVFLETSDLSKTPTVSDISFTFTSACIPPGQVFFSGLLNNSYNIEVTKDNYEPYSGTVSTTQPWQEDKIILLSN